MDKETIQEINKVQKSSLSDSEKRSAIHSILKERDRKLYPGAVDRVEVSRIAKEMYLEVGNMDIDATTISDCIACTASKCREVLERKLQALPPAAPTSNTATVDAIIIPEGATNGDMIRALFPNVEITDKGFHNIAVTFGDYRNQMYPNRYDEEWWNAPYYKE